MDYQKINDTFNKVLNDNRLSLKAKGIYTIIYRDILIKVTLENFSLISKDGKTSIMAGVNELIKYNYLKREAIHDKDGRFIGNKYILIFE